MKEEKENRSDQWYWTSEAAEYLGVKPRTVRFWATIGALRAAKIRKRWRFREKWLDEFIKRSNEQMRSES